MKSISIKIIIFGATGMLGRAIYKYLSKKNSNVYGTSRKLKSKFIYLNAQNKIEKLKKIFIKIKPEYVINCIGALKDANKVSLKDINSDFPKTVARISKTHRFKIISISTDAVFGNLQEKVTEDSIPIPDNKYGKSKIEGEQKLNTLSIRTSIIGFDPNEHKGILEFLIKNKKTNNIGFLNQNWSGATTLQLAKFIEDLIYNKRFRSILKKTNVIHFSPIKTNKYDIVRAFANILKLKKPKKGLGIEINRILESKYISKNELKQYGNSLTKALKELINFDKNYVKKFKKN